jgi:predicted dehydrogenase
VRDDLGNGASAHRDPRRGAHRQHGSWNLAAIEAGKHVLSEKPSAPTADEAAEVRTAAQKAGVTVVEGFHYLFHPVMQPSGVTGAVRASLVHSRFEMTLRVVGSRGEAKIMDFVQPHKDDRVLVRTGTDLRTAHMDTRSSYIYQLEEFITALRSGWRMPTDPDDAVATAQLIDQCYRAAGLPLRLRKLALLPDVDQMI